MTNWGDNRHELLRTSAYPAALTTLGNALGEMRRFEEAITACQDAVAIFRETADRHWEDIALDNLEKYRAAQALSSERQ